MPTCPKCGWKVRTGNSPCPGCRYNEWVAQAKVEAKERKRKEQENEKK